MSARRGPLRRLLGQARDERRGVIVLVGLDLLHTPLYLLAPLPLKVTIDSVLGTQPLPTWLAWMLPDAMRGSPVALLASMAVLQVLVVLGIQSQAVGVAVRQKRTGADLTFGLRARLFRHLQRQSAAFHDQQGTSDSLYRVQYDAPAVEFVLVQGLIPLVGAVVAFVSIIGVTAGIDRQLAAVALAISPVLVLLASGYRRRMRPRYREAKRLESSAFHVVQEALGAARVVKAFGREDVHSRHFEHRARTSNDALVQLAWAEGLYELGVKLATGAGAAGVLFLGGRGVLTGRITLGELTLIMSYLTQLYGPLQTVSRTVASLQKHLASAQRVFEVLDRTPDVTERPDARPVARARGDISIQGLGFAYPDSPPVLRDVDLHVASGRRIGIVGRTGAGKTTLLNLLVRFQDPTEGSIRLDGVDLRDYRLADLREQYAVVLQDAVLFSTTIAENIAYGRIGARPADIVRAARNAGAHAFIEALPEGYDTTVGERGMRLSGGERQRIALARAFLKDAPVLILDEPTSAVDVLTERGIMEAMERLMRDRTTFMVAHRLSTLRDCDVVVEVVDGGLTVVDPSSWGAAPTSSTPTEVRS